MRKAAALIILLSIIPASADAGIYRCRDAQGKTVYTDDPAYLPPGCAADVVTDLPPLNVVHSPPVFTPGAGKPGVQSPAQPNVKGTATSAENAYDNLKESANSLVEQFKSTRSAIYKARRSTDRDNARRDLEQVRLKKQSMLDNLDGSTLTRSQKADIRQILSQISDS